jgi:ApaG protein
MHVFTYTITIKNTGEVPAQLISRHWVITDANNKPRKCAAWAWSATSRC